MPGAAEQNHIPCYDVHLSHTRFLSTRALVCVCVCAHANRGRTVVLMGGGKGNETDRQTDRKTHTGGEALIHESSGARTWHLSRPELNPLETSLGTGLVEPSSCWSGWRWNCVVVWTLGGSTLVSHRRNSIRRLLCGGLRDAFLALVTGAKKTLAQKRSKVCARSGT